MKKETAAEAIERRELFRVLTENSNEMISMVSANRRIVFQSPSIQKILGYTAEERMGKDIKDIIHPQDKELLTSTFNRSIENPGIPITQKIRVKRKDGEYLVIQSSYTNRLGIKDINAIIINEMDITTPDKLEQEINLLNSELEIRVNARTRQLEIANKELEAFSYSVSHDLRAPLRAVIGFSTMLKEDYEAIVNAEGNRIIDTVVSNAKMMGQLIDDLLSFSRMGRLEVIKKGIDMSLIAQSCIQELMVNSQENRYRVSIDSLPLCEGDVRMIKKVWTNLIDNALKFSSKKKTILK